MQEGGNKKERSKIKKRCNGSTREVQSPLNFKFLVLKRPSALGPITRSVTVGVFVSSVYFYYLILLIIIYVGIVLITRDQKSYV